MTASASHPRVAVATMLQADEFDRVLPCLQAVRAQLDDVQRWYVLRNGPGPERIRQWFAGDERIRFSASDRNLGVPAGRNALLREALADGADWIACHDCDLLAARSYFRRGATLCTQLAARHGEWLGMVAPALLDGTAVRQTLGPDGKTFDPDAMRALVADAAVDQRAPLWHAGVRGWRRHYLLGIEPLRRAWRFAAGRRHRPGPSTFLADDADTRIAIADAGGPRPADTLPGGASWLPAAMLERVGLLDESFGPFGFEDAELGIRATRAGYRHLLLPALLLVHDPAGMAPARDEAMTACIRGRSRRRLLRACEPNPVLRLGWQVLAVTLEPSLLAGRGFWRCLRGKTCPRKPLEAVFSYLLGFATLAGPSGPGRPRHPRRSLRDDR